MYVFVIKVAGILEAIDWKRDFPGTETIDWIGLKGKKEVCKGMNIYQIFSLKLSH